MSLAFVAPQHVFIKTGMFLNGILFPGGVFKGVDEECYREGPYKFHGVSFITGKLQELITSLTLSATPRQLPGMVRFVRYTGFLLPVNCQ